MHPGRDPDPPQGEPTARERVRGRAQEQRRRISTRMRAWRQVRRWSIGAVGGTIMVLGLALVPLPGPGWLIVFVGLGILASEFEWAERLLRWGRGVLHRWTSWANSQPLWVRLAIALVGLVTLAAVLFGLAWAWGLLPGGLRDLVRS